MRDCNGGGTPGDDGPFVLVPLRLGRRGIVFLSLLAIVLGAPQGGEAFLFSGQKTIEKTQAKIAQLPEKGKLRTKAVLYSDLGVMQYKQGNFDAAIAALEQALTYRPKKKIKKRTYLYLGKSYESHVGLEEAIGAYEQAVIYDRKNWKRHRDLGQQHAAPPSLGDHDPVTSHLYPLRVTDLFQGGEGADFYAEVSPLLLL